MTWIDDRRFEDNFADEHQVAKNLVRTCRKSVMLSTWQTKDQAPIEDVFGTAAQRSKRLSKGFVKGEIRRKIQAQRSLSRRYIGDRVGQGSV